MTQAHFIDGYISAALHDLELTVTEELRSDGQADPDSAQFSRANLAEETLKTIEAECVKFYAENSDLCQSAGLTDTEAGYCFHHNRNGAGVGFWDRNEFTATEGNELSSRSHAFGTADWYVGDDGLIYQFESQLDKSVGAL